MKIKKPSYLTQKFKNKKEKIKKNWVAWLEHEIKHPIRKKLLLQGYIEKSNTFKISVFHLKIFELKRPFLFLIRFYQENIFSEFV